jgi:hypothetical protein
VIAAAGGCVVLLAALTALLHGDDVRRLWLQLQQLALAAALAVLIVVLHA